MHHLLKASGETCHWGFFDATLKPRLTIKSGDQVTIQTVTGGPEMHPPQEAGFYTPPEITNVHKYAEKTLPGHILTGPVAIEGAKPGNVLEVRIDAVKLRQDWGYTFIRPLAGTLPDDFHHFTLRHIALNEVNLTAALPWGGTLPLSPFFGVMGTAPPKNWGRITSLVPRAFGGNLDNKELVGGTTLYLPVFVDGALFSCGDGHAAQGDGEVCVTAIETALEGTFTFILREDLALPMPRAETPTHHITMHVHPDLDLCAEQALRDMIRLICESSSLSREDAYMLCSLAADLRITQTVNGSKGVHCMLAKSVLPPSA
jgi:acetamidase/formamidase